jgi:glycosyltransferase involved in cell wall biosynthesis
MSSKVSVVMSVFNGERFLVDAIESILTQTFTDFVLVVIDDGSTDNTGDILRESAHKDNRVSVVFQQNQGLTKSLISAINAFDSEFIARMDADDISAPDRIEKQVTFLEAHRECGLLGTSAMLVDGQRRKLKEASLPLSNHAIRAQLKKRNVFVHGSVMMRRSTYQASGGYDPRFKYSQDFDLWLRMAKCAKVANLPESLYFLRHHESSISVANQNKQLELAATALMLDQVSGNKQPKVTEREISSLLEDFPARQRHRIYARLATSRGMYNRAIEYYSSFFSLESILMLIVLRHRFLTKTVKWLYTKVRKIAFLFR